MNIEEEILLPLITHAGSAKSNAFEALDVADSGDFEAANQLVRDARKEVVLAHKTQTSLLRKEASGEETKISVLLIHAQDHLMTTLLAIDLIEQMIGMKKEIKHIAEKK